MCIRDSYGNSKKEEVEIKTSVQQAVQALDEISKKTLGSYVKKAATEIGTSAMKGDYKKMQKRHKGVLDASDKMTKEEVIPDAKVDKGSSDYGKASIRNYRRMGPGHDDPGMFDPSGKRGKTIEKRKEEHKARRGVKGAKVPAYKVDEGSSYGLYKGSGKAKGAMKDFLDKKAKMLTKKRNAQSDAAKNNPHFDSTQPSPSGRNKYEHVSFKNYFTEGNNTARMLHKSKTSVTGNISADRGGDEKKNQASRKGLEKDLKKKGIGYKKGVGKYKYDSGETGTEVSYQTSKPDKMSKRRFGKTMRRLGRKHGQESVITKDKKKPARLHDTESKKPGKSINVGKSKGGSNPSGMGQTSGDKVRSGKLPNKSKKGAYHYG